MPDIDYSSKMPDTIFTYDKDFYTDDLPDPQIDPVLPGARVPLKKVGIAPVDLPVVLRSREGGEKVLQTEASLYCSLDDPMAKGLNLSRLYLIMHEQIKDKLSLDGMEGALRELAEKQGSKNAYCKLRFKYPMHQKALRTRGVEGHIAYKTELEGQYIDGDYKWFLTVDYVYSSTCPCSFELAHDARSKRNAAANAHSQRSILKVKVAFPRTDNNIIWIEDIVDLCREHIPTEVQIVVKRRDEQAFAELNGANLLFSEDAVRIMHAGLDEWVQAGRIDDFSIVASHEESLHPWNAIAVSTGGYGVLS
jgi:GTP cyclohydrolase I|tara:strand:- start:2253 stop:3173 length:921 start_codon:yes stop_codon:yes gene_type:complete